MSTELSSLRLHLWMALCCAPVVGVVSPTLGCTSGSSSDATSDRPPTKAKVGNLWGPRKDSTGPDGAPPELEHLPTCPSGTWCGTVASVEPLRPTPDERDQGPAAPEDFESCPGWFRTGLSEAEITALGQPDLYSDLPLGDASVTLDLAATKAKRAEGQADACCYRWMESCPGGRPLLDQGRPRLARLQRGHAWTAALPKLDRGAINRLGDDARRTIATAWLADARMEHSSIASFERAKLELEAVDAPESLLEGCQRAAEDERRHTRIAFGLAAAYAGSSLEPQPLDDLEVRPGGLVRVAIDTFIEGCVGETVAAACVRRAASEALDPELAHLLEGIADDEGDHAALAWQTLAWAVERGGEAICEALRDVADELRPEGASSSVVAAFGERAHLRGHGQLDEASQAGLRREAWALIIDPLLIELTGRR